MKRQIQVNNMLPLPPACILSLALIFLAALTGCSSSQPQPGVSTLSQFTEISGDSSFLVNDASAQTTADGYLCIADGDGSDQGNNIVSTAPGACFYPMLYTNTTYNFYFASIDCYDYFGEPSWYQSFSQNTGPSGSVTADVCTLYDYDLASGLSSNFAMAGSLPSTITAYASGFSSAYGMPKLLVYNTAGAIVGTATATSVAANGSSATFPFPTAVSGGTPLPSAFYFAAPKNFTNSTGGFTIPGGSYFSIGGTTTISTPFGVTVAPLTTVVQNCGPDVCSNPTTTTSPLPLITSYDGGQVTWDGFGTSVGSEPVAVAAWGSASGTETIPEGDEETLITMTGPAYALVANLGSGMVSVVQFDYQSTGSNNPPITGMSVIHNIAVGAKPMSVTLNSANTMGYVASYGSGTLAEINLSTFAVSRTATGLTGALSVAMDPSGSYVWVGGANYLYKVSLSTFTVVASYPVSGTVTSLAASNAQKELVYTLVENCCSASSTYAADEVSLSNMAVLGTHASASAAAYAPYTMNGTLPSAAVIPSATAVSAQFGNGMAASATPTGFVIYDVVSHKQVMTGTTPTPVRGIASDPDSTVAYFTLPDSNEYITVPLPQP